MKIRVASPSLLQHIHGDNIVGGRLIILEHSLSYRANTKTNTEIRPDRVINKLILLS